MVRLWRSSKKWSAAPAETFVAHYREKYSEEAHLPFWMASELVIRHVLLRIWPQCKWRDRLFALMDQHPEIDLGAMRFPRDWRAALPWTDSGK
jgi:hypothetical protein